MKRKTFVSRLVVEKLHPVLKESGFRRFASTWNRPAHGFIQVVNVQASMVNMPGSESCTVNLGIFWRDAYEICWQKSPKYAREFDCAIRTRLGPLLEGDLLGGRDRWWDVNSERDLELVGDEVTSAVLTRALPFLDKFASLADLHDFLSTEFGRATGVLYLALAKGELGDLEGARTIVAPIKSAPGDPAELVAKHLGLSNGA